MLTLSSTGLVLREWGKNLDLQRTQKLVVMVGRRAAQAGPRRSPGLAWPQAVVPQCFHASEGATSILMPDLKTSLLHPMHERHMILHLPCSSNLSPFPTPSLLPGSLASPLDVHPEFMPHATHWPDLSMAPTAFRIKMTS